MTGKLSSQPDGSIVCACSPQRACIDCPQAQSFTVNIVEYNASGSSLGRQSGRVVRVSALSRLSRAFYKSSTTTLQISGSSELIALQTAAYKYHQIITRRSHGVNPHRSAPRGTFARDIKYITTTLQQHVQERTLTGTGSISSPPLTMIFLWMKVN